MFRIKSLDHCLGQMSASWIHFPTLMLSSPPIRENGFRIRTRERLLPDCAPVQITPLLGNNVSCIWDRRQLTICVHPSWSFASWEFCEFGKRVQQQLAIAGHGFWHLLISLWTWHLIFKNWQIPSLPQTSCQPQVLGTDKVFNSKSTGCWDGQF